jgi:hypothetical protein
MTEISVFSILNFSGGKCFYQGSSAHALKTFAGKGLDSKSFDFADEKTKGGEVVEFECFAGQ